MPAITAPGLITSQRVLLVAVRWVDGTAPGDTVVIQDGAGRTVWESVAAGTHYGETDTFPAPRLYTGLTVSALDSGRLYVDFDAAMAP